MRQMESVLVNYFFYNSPLGASLLANPTLSAIRTNREQARSYTTGRRGRRRSQDRREDYNVAVTHHNAKHS